jgi:hypothetical protein
MRLSDLVWDGNPNVDAYANAMVVHRATGAKHLVYLTEEGTYDVVTTREDDLIRDHRGLSKLELAALLEAFDPEPTTDE